MMLDDVELTDFIAQSNAIERIVGVSEMEFEAHKRLLALPAITVEDLQAFVWDVVGAPLRRPSHPDIRVGNHRPPPGGETIRYALEWLCVNIKSIPPILVHDAYLWVHPFMDGNGRSSRAIWLWCMLARGRLGEVLECSLLHNIYYQHLDQTNGDMKKWWERHGHRM